MQALMNIAYTQPPCGCPRPLIITMLTDKIKYKMLILLPHIAANLTKETYKNNAKRTIKSNISY